VTTAEDHAGQQRAQAALEGLAVGDAFGHLFFFPQPDGLPGPPWHWTDDTQMALSVYEQVVRGGAIDQERLAAAFASRYEPARGYGPNMHEQLRLVRDGTHWRTAARAAFGGQGTYGNGAAMRIAPLGAYFAHDLDQTVTQARLASEVTHAHPEGVAGGIAVATATALAAAEPSLEGDALLEAALAPVPDGEVARGILEALGLPTRASVRTAVRRLGNGSRVSAQDTVPFALWCAARHSRDFEAALRLTVQGGGDVDTTCAMVGGIVAARVGRAGIPEEWCAARERLPAWVEGS
jgi:ADP-ribosylglycohydrolase